MQPDLFTVAEVTPASVLDALSTRLGAANGINARALCAAITGRHTAQAERALRTVVVALRTAGHRICATPDEGYFIADTPQELDHTCVFLYRRSMTGLVQIAAMRRVSLPDLAGQLRLPIGASNDAAFNR